MSLLYVVVLAVIVVVLLAVALYRTSQVKTKADYLVAGRSLPAVVLVLTLLTSWVGARVPSHSRHRPLQPRPHGRPQTPLAFPCPPGRAGVAPPPPARSQPPAGR